MAVVANLDTTDRIFKRGTIIKSINKIPANKIINKMLLYLPEEGYAHNVNYIRISNNFPALHRNIFGLSKTYNVVYLDSIGFSGFNTAITAIESDLPIVTLKGKFMRGRLAAGVLKRVGLEELVAKNEVEYVEIGKNIVSPNN
jgi:hypothetical protein